LVGIGDDAMVLNSGIVVSTDSFVEGVHFDLNYFTMFSLGYHCMAASLSDLAAMGALPSCALISLMLAPDITKNKIRQLYRGFQKICQKYQVNISGGDVVSSPSLNLTITVIGVTKNPLLRSRARPGQFLYMTNFLGLAEVGRLALKGQLPKRRFSASI